MSFENMLSQRLGMFVHYGIYSAFAGEAFGKKIPMLGEWIQLRGEIPNEKYEQFGRDNFCPSSNFAQNLVSAAKTAGMRYIVLTSKHHDGFALFKTRFSDYSSYNFFGRDLCREVADECRKQGLEIGFYYSQCLDWHEKNGAGNYVTYEKKSAHNRNYWDFPDDNIDFEQYFSKKCLPQVEELLTNYGDVKLLWFDFPHDITIEQSIRLRSLVKSIQPSCLINSRIGHGQSDYDSLGDNALPVAPVDANLECLITLNDTWGYKKDDNNWKTPEEVIEILQKTLGSNSTLLVNVGPKADGSLTPETESLLKHLGEWTNRNSQAVYGNISGSPLPFMLKNFNLSTDGKNVFLYSKGNNKTISLSGINGKIKKISVIGCDKEVTFSQKGGETEIFAPKTEFLSPVYKIEFDGEIGFDNHIKEYKNSLSLGVLWAKKGTKNSNTLSPLPYEKHTGDFENHGKRGVSISKTVLTDHWADDSEYLCWEAEFEGGKYIAEMVHAVLDSTWTERTLNSTFTLSVASQSQTVDIENEKSRIYLSRSSESNSNLRIVRNAGEFEIKEKGKYTVCLYKESGDEHSLISHINFIKK